MPTTVFERLVQGTSSLPANGFRAELNLNLSGSISTHREAELEPVSLACVGLSFFLKCSIGRLFLTACSIEAGSCPGRRAPAEAGWGPGWPEGPGAAPQHLSFLPLAQGCTMARCSRQPPSAGDTAQAEGSSPIPVSTPCSHGPWASYLASRAQVSALSVREGGVGARTVMLSASPSPSGDPGAPGASPEPSGTREGTRGSWLGASHAGFSRCSHHSLP